MWTTPKKPLKSQKIDFLPWKWSKFVKMTMSRQRYRIFSPQNSLLFTSFLGKASKWVENVFFVFFFRGYFFSGPRFWVSECTLNFFWEKKIYAQNWKKIWPKKINQPQDKKKQNRPKSSEWVRVNFFGKKKHGTFEPGVRGI